MDVKDTKDTRLEEIIITEEMYTNLFKMLNADEADQVVALNCIKNLEKKANLVPILFLRKECSNTHFSLWQEHCPKVLKYHLTLGVTAANNMIKFANILHAMKEQKRFKQENLMFFTKRFEVFVKNNLLGFDFIEDLEIKIKIKNE